MNLTFSGCASSTLMLSMKFETSLNLFFSSTVDNVILPLAYLR